MVNTVNMLKLNLSLQAKTHEDIILLLKKTIADISDQNLMYHYMEKLGNFSVQSGGGKGNRLDYVLELPNGSIEKSLSDDQINVIKSCVGLGNNPNQKYTFYRNKYCCNKGAGAEQILITLISMGFMKQSHSEGINDYYYLTDSGLRQAKQYAKFKDTFPEQPKESD